jgi:hypothetical protein
MINGQTSPIFVQNSHERPFSKNQRLTPTDFWPRNHLHQKSKNVIYGKETYVGLVYEPLVNDQWAHNPYFCRKYNERQFSLIPKANTYKFLPKKWSPPKIQECDRCQGNICEVTCMSLWSMINGHSTLIFVENSLDRPFSIILKANTYGFLTKNGLQQKSKNVIYGKEIYVGWGVRASGQWSMATQPLFLSKIAWTTIFNNIEG